MHVQHYYLNDQNLFWQEHHLDNSQVMQMADALVMHTVTDSQEEKLSSRKQRNLTHTHMHAHTHKHAHTHTHKHTHTHTHLHVHLYTHMLMYISFLLLRCWMIRTSQEGFELPAVKDSKPNFNCTMPMHLDDGQNQIQFNLADFTRRAYRTNYIY